MERKVSGNTLHIAATLEGEAVGVRTTKILRPLDVVLVHKHVHQGQQVLRSQTVIEQQPFVL